MGGKYNLKVSLREEYRGKDRNKKYTVKNTAVTPLP
jgi:hypothetical protein